MQGTRTRVDGDRGGDGGGHKDVQAQCGWLGQQQQKECCRAKKYTGQQQQKQQQQKAFNILMQVPAEGGGGAAGWRVAGNVLNVLKNRNESVSQDEG